MAGKSLHACRDTLHLIGHRGGAGLRTLVHPDHRHPLSAGHAPPLADWRRNRLARPREVALTNGVAMPPILGAYHLSREGDAVAGSGK